MPTTKYKTILIIFTRKNIMSILNFFKTLGKFFAGLFKAAEKHIDELPEETRETGILAALFTQIIKVNAEAAEHEVNQLLKDKLKLTDEQLDNIFTILRSKYNIPTAFTVTRWLQIKFHDITDDILHNSFANEIFNVVAIELSDGKLNWVTLAMGIGEVLYRKFVKGVDVKLPPATQEAKCPQPPPSGGGSTPFGNWVCRNGAWVWVPELG